ncbi:MAG: M56 family metallopeptidase, partial [Gemmatimonadota bacterium]
MSDLLAALADVAVRGGALVGVAMLISLAMRRSSAAARHAVVALGILSHLLVPVVPITGLHVRLPYPASDRDVVAQSLAAAPATAPIRPPDGSWSVATDPAEPGGEPAPVDLAWVLGLTWLGVAAVVLGRYAAGLFKVALLRAGGRPLRNEVPGQVISAAARAAGLRRSPEIRFADVSMPIACGIVRSTVLLPEAAANWSASRLRMVLVHEMAHVRRRDVAVQGLAQLVCALFWFDPLLWLARDRLRAEAESAADDVVLRAGTPPDQYVLELVSLLREGGRDPLPASTASIGRAFGARARRTLDPYLHREAVRRRSLVAGFLTTLAVTLVLGGLVPAATSAGGNPAAVGLPSGCAWRPDGRHVNRWTEATGRLAWQVAWEGENCEVELFAESGAVLADGILAPVDGGRVVVRVRRGATVDSAVLVRDGHGRFEITASPGLAGRAGLAAWLPAFAHEVALHTAYDAPQRVDALLGEGGVSAVLATANAARG